MRDTGFYFLRHQFSVSGEACRQQLPSWGNLGCLKTLQQLHPQHHPAMKQRPHCRPCQPARHHVPRARNWDRGVGFSKQPSNLEALHPLDRQSG
ncbi:hypothetical protein PSPO01_01964 [Paraphaeosphaeria sporulosa]